MTASYQPLARRSPSSTGLSKRHRDALARAATIVVLMGAPLFSLLLVSSPLPLETRFVGWVLWIACLVPSWQYFSKNAGRPPIPFVPVIGLLYLMYYARPLVFGSYNEHWRIRVNPAVDYDFPAQLALEGWLLMLVGWYALMPRLRRLAPVEYDFYRVRRIALVCAWLGPIAHVAQFTASLPLIIAGIAQFLFTLGYFGMGLLMMIVASKRGDFLTKVTLIGSAASLGALQLASGFISQFLVTGAVLILAYWAVRGRLNPTLVISAVLLTTVTFVVKSTLVDYRQVAWRSSGATGMTNEAKLSLMTGLATKKVDEEGLVGAITSGSKSSATRSANMDLLADVVRKTPSQVPFWKGATYVSLIGFAIPRFLWPDKPTKFLGQTFGHRYGLLDPHDTHTSFNLPFLIEFYANFGEIGVVIGMFLVGLIYGALARVMNRAGQNGFITMMGIVLYLPLLNIESDFSLTFGGLLLNAIGLWTLSYVAIGKVKRSRRSATPPMGIQHRPGMLSPPQEGDQRALPGMAR